MRFRAKSKPKRVPGVMNKTETAYSHHLESRKREGLILSWMYEPVKFRLAKATTYTPDFMVVCADLTIEHHEVKGSWNAPHQEDSRVKIKVAAEMFPMFGFSSFVPSGGLGSGLWEREDF